MLFQTESAFEKAVIEKLVEYGWEEDVIYYPTEEKLIQNWADILFNNNQQIDRLNDCPLTRTEMDQILEQIISLKSPMKLSGLSLKHYFYFFILGKVFRFFCPRFNFLRSL